MGKLVRLARDKISGEVFFRGNYSTFREPMNLVCDTETGILYYKFSEKISIVVKGKMLDIKVGYMSPFINSNGELCHFGDTEINSGRLTRLAKDPTTNKYYPSWYYNPLFQPQNFVYDENTGIVYYKLSEKVSLLVDGELITSRVGYMSPYIGPNGKYCRFENDDICEIV